MPCSKERRHSLENLKTLFFLSTGSLCFYFLLFCYIYISIYLYIDIYIYRSPPTWSDQGGVGRRQTSFYNKYPNFCVLRAQEAERTQHGPVAALICPLPAPLLPFSFLPGSLECQYVTVKRAPSALSSQWRIPVNALTISCTGNYPTGGELSCDFTYVSNQGHPLLSPAARSTCSSDYLCLHFCIHTK